MSDPFDFGDGEFQSVARRMATERIERLDAAKHLLTFGVKCLDVLLGGIERTDLILIGAKLGIGKTELASLIAQANAEKGKRVHYFALEAEDKEIERRMKFRRLSELVYDSARSTSPAFADMVRHRMNFLDWKLGRLDDLTGRFEPAVDDALGLAYGNLFTFYRIGDFTGAKMEKIMRAIQGQTDLIVLDHLHFVDLPDGNENTAVKALTKKLRDLALEMGKPVICIAHVRKGDRRLKQLVPDAEDFMGTSDVPKIATKAIMLAPAYDQPTGHAHLWNTYMRPVKCRPDGSRTRYCASVVYNVRHNRYEEHTIGRLINGGEKWEVVPSSAMPGWAQ